MKKSSNQTGRESFALRLCQSGGRLMNYLTYFLLFQTAGGVFSKSMQEQAKQSSTPALWTDTDNVYLTCPPGSRTVVLSSNLQAIYSGKAPQFSLTKEQKEKICTKANTHLQANEQVSLAVLEQRASASRFEP